MRLLLHVVLLLALVKVSALTRKQPFKVSPSAFLWRLKCRGGADVRAVGVDSEDEDESEDRVDEEEFEDDLEDEEVEKDSLDPKLTKSTVKSVFKARTSEKKSVKEKVSTTLKSKKRTQRSLLKALRVPYILRACMNPFTVFTMTKAYFSSLFNLNYLKEDTSENLRSALEEKSKKSSGLGGRKGKRQMRPGQAKTLSDLPQLSS